jgi:basic amino acid/polyamine antiporter, APA family
MAVVQLKTNLRLFEAITIIVGSMIGSGILRLPGNMADTLHSPGLVILAWVAGAFLTVMGVLTFAEMAGMFPRAGGQYHYLREGLGPAWSYLFGWTMFWVIMSGIVASVSLAFADFFSGLVGGLPGHNAPLVIGGWETGITLPPWGNAFVAIGLILVLSLVNYLSSAYGGLVSNYTTIGKYVGLLALVAILFIWGSDSRPSDAFEPLLESTDQAGGALIVAFGSAMALTLFAFDGWPQATFVASEIQNPKRNLVRAMLIGPLLVALIYIVLTVSYFYVISLDEAIAIGQDAQGRIAVEAARAAVGENGAKFISIVALVSTLGATNAYVLTSPRIFYAMANDGALLKGMARLSEKRATPAFALLIFTLWSCLLVMSGVYVQIVKMVVYGIWLFYIPTAIAHMRLRRTHAHVERPFRTPLYPLVPILFLLASLFVVYVSWFDPEGGLNADAPYMAVATGIMLLGLPFYFLQRKRRTDVPGDDQAPPGTAPPADDPAVH